MDFSLFGIGFPQIMLILVIALIVFGPERLPGMARQAGRYVNELRRMTQDARGEIQNLTKELDIREDLNSVKADLLNIKNDLTATATGISKDFENIRKEVTLRDTDGNTMGAQLEQSTYSVTNTPAADGTDTLRVEENIQRETIIQDAIENTPATATEVISSTTSGSLEPGEAGEAIDGLATTAALNEPALRVINPARQRVINPARPRVINPARPMDTYNTQAEGLEPAELATTPDLTEATESTSVEGGLAQTPAVNLNGSVEAGAPETLAQAPAFPETTANPEAVPAYTFSGTPAAEFAVATPPPDQDWEESLEKTRQEFNERIDKLESQFMERLDRVEKLLGSQFIRAHQEQGG
jgi:Tat protein translocase TatB subunit